MKDAVDNMLAANCKSLCGSIEEVCVIRFYVLCHLIVLQYLHTLGSNTGPKAAARAKATFAKGVISRIDELGA